MKSFRKMPGVGAPKGPRRKKQRSESSRLAKSRKEQNRIIKIRSLVLIGMAMLVFGICCVVWMFRHEKPPELVTTSSPKIAPKAEVKTKVISRFPAPSSAEALALVKQALALRDPSHVADYFRQDRASPQEIIDFLQGMDARDGALDRLQWLSSINSTAIPLEGVDVKFKGLEKPGSRIALLTPDAAGKWRIDFDAFARTVTPSWTDLLEKQAAVGTVRVFIKKDAYYNGPFIDDKKWLCYAIGSTDSKETLEAYCKIGSPQAGAIAWMLSKGAKITRTTLEIRRVEGAESRQFEISRVLAEDWVMDSTPFEEGFK